MVTIDAEGYVRITDRSKDVIKSGGEWISSRRAGERADEPPRRARGGRLRRRATPSGTSGRIAAVVFKEGLGATRDELTAHIEGRFAKFWLPDDYVVVKQIPRTSTGKFLKSKLRDEYGDHLIKQGH